MKFTRNASANWKGGGKDGKGTLTTDSTVLNKTPYSFSTRFEDEKGTNPEELIGAAHAGCFTMKLSFVLGEAGYTATNLDTKAKVTFQDGVISRIDLILTGEVPNISESEFLSCAENAKLNCPISKLLNTEIVLTAQLV